ncbi:Oidioi.mRNA.OKI2018_I69.PAR.g12016.t2.cds [Oikopleura dioica]|uniref:Oidioi.mRNA.OKI2018_I69.PAR.g12016.t2.cds n=1 Tax=Oikopleura dioica TaxID=34765 RepID=A0ABN7S552_OIKDI|nr:Oidioi.mRNA.OKI2018_I69.PAR.g12016.t2.cds [Oikopleura dioica]
MPNIDDEPPQKKLRAEIPSDDASIALLEKVYEVQKGLDEIHSKSAEEIVAVEIKYNKLRVPLYEKRAKAISEIPNFWLTTLVNHPIIAESMSEHDAQILEHLETIDVVENEDIKSGYSMEFKFKKNAYFTNESVTKKVTMSEEGDNTVEITTIDWTDKEMQEKCAPEADEGFIAWLQSEVDPEVDEIGNLIKDDLWPTPMEYYNMQEESDEEDEDDEGVGESGDC